jgi:hypothetical protein
MRNACITAIIVIVAVLCGTGQAAADSAAQGPSFRFVVMGDRNGGYIQGLWPQAVEQVNLLKPELVMSVGDFIEGYTEDQGEIDKQWTRFLAENSKLEAPFYFTPGNHDETNAVERATYLKLFGKDGRSYYSFDYKGCHFAVLDSNLFTKQGVDPNQIGWFAMDMAGAKDAKHIFVFYHHPAGAKSAAWKQIAPLLKPGKATVFNGHTHSMSYARQDGIDTYTLAATAASLDDTPDFGDLHMFALVTFSDGKPTVASIRVGEVRSAKSVDRSFSDTAYPLTESTSFDQSPTPAGRKVDVAQPNPSPLAFDVTLVGDSPGFVVAPQKTTMNVQPNKAASASFEVRDCATQAQDALSLAPKVRCTYVFTNPEGRKATRTIITTLGRFSTIRRVKGITIDGKLDDWADVKPEALPSFDKLQTEGQGWLGKADCSAELRLACDETTVFVAISVTDDNLRAGLTPATENDGWAFQWSVPAKWRTDDPNAPFTGAARLIPTPGKVTPQWGLKKNLKRPSGFQATASKTERGYICEMAMPLADIGAKSPLQPSETLNWRVQLRDIDQAGKQADVFTVGGTTDPAESARTWITGVFE